jgi:CP family cyanate transporter-like MFS transporter
MTILAVPPLLPDIHRELHLDETAVGFLTGLPVLLLAIAAVPGSLLIARVGARRALIIGLLSVGVAGAARGLFSAYVLFAMTFIMGCGVAISQPSMPSLVKAWIPQKIGLGTAVFSNGILIGEIVAVALTGPLLLTSLDGSWQAALAFWSVPVLMTAAAIALATKHVPRDAAAARLSWWPDWKNATTWKLGFILGGAGAAYWSANAFIPDYLRAFHHAGLTTAALTALNLVQLPASLGVAAVPHRLVGRSWPLSAAGVLTAVATAGLIVLPGSWVIVAAGLLGFSTALVFVLALALPPLLTPEWDTHRLSAAMFTIAYCCPFVGALIGGALWDLSGTAATAFVPVLVGGAMMFSIPRRLDLRAAQDSATGIAGEEDGLFSVSVQ